MTEYFIIANSFAAPFVSDISESFFPGDDPVSALNGYAASYSHPRGLYAAVAYSSADAYHKGEKTLAKWLCNHERKKQSEASGSKGGYSYLCHSPGSFEIDGRQISVKDPRQGFAETCPE